MPSIRPLVGVVLGTAIFAGTLAGLTACDPVSRSWSWRAGKTHGAIIETTAGRASLGIYRIPTKALHVVLKHLGVSKVQDYLWEYGKPPELKKTFTYKGHSLKLEFGAGTQALRTLTKKLIYDDPGDLKSALIDANKKKACLALTLISYGKPTSNWTHKNTDCIDGSLG